MLHRLEASCSGIRRSPPVVADVGSAAEVWAATKAGSVAAVPDLEAEAQEVTDWAVREVEETGVEGWEAEATEVTDWVVQEVEETAGTGVEGLAGTVVEELAEAVPARAEGSEGEGSGLGTAGLGAAGSAGLVGSAESEEQTCTSRLRSTAAPVRTGTGQTGSLRMPSRWMSRLTHTGGTVSARLRG